MAALQRTLAVFIVLLLVSILAAVLNAVMMKRELDARPTIAQIDKVLQLVESEIKRLDKNDEKLLDTVAPLLGGKIKKSPEEAPVKK